MAIRNACRELGTFDLSGCEIYTTGEPCPMCLGACLWANLNHIYYGGTSLDIDGLGFRDDVFYRQLNKKEELLQQVGRDACLELFEEYSNIKSKTAY
jgi:tRNA(Arg) A34 adenosine deaminase TadA